MKAIDPAAQMVKDSAYRTDWGDTWYHVTFRRKIRDVDIEQDLYFLDGLAGKKIVVTTGPP